MVWHDLTDSHGPLVSEQGVSPVWRCRWSPRSIIILQYKSEEGKVRCSDVVMTLLRPTPPVSKQQSTRCGDSRQRYSQTVKRCWPGDVSVTLHREPTNSCAKKLQIQIFVILLFFLCPMERTDEIEDNSKRDFSCEKIGQSKTRSFRQQNYAPCGSHLHIRNHKKVVSGMDSQASKWNEDLSFCRAQTCIKWYSFFFHGSFCVVIFVLSRLVCAWKRSGRVALPFEASVLTAKHRKKLCEFRRLHKRQRTNEHLRFEWSLPAKTFSFVKTFHSSTSEWKSEKWPEKQCSYIFSIFLHKARVTWKTSKYILPDTWGQPPLSPPLVYCPTRHWSVDYNLWYHWLGQRIWRGLTIQCIFTV